MIRTAEAADVPRIVELGREFHAYSPHRIYPFDPDAFAQVAEKLIEGRGVFLSDDGMVGGCVSPLYFSPQTLFAVELFWWAKTEGRQLREAFEAWAKAQGAATVQFTCLMDERVATVSKVFKRAGYHPAEVAFLKRF